MLLGKVIFDCLPADGSGAECSITVGGGDRSTIEIYCGEILICVMLVHVACTHQFSQPKVTKDVE
jgi:hypothetical protein